MSWELHERVAPTVTGRREVASSEGVKHVRRGRFLTRAVRELAAVPGFADGSWGRRSAEEIFILIFFSFLFARFGPVSALAFWRRVRRALEVSRESLPGSSAVLCSPSRPPTPLLAFLAPPRCSRCAQGTPGALGNSTEPQCRTAPYPSLARPRLEHTFFTKDQVMNS